MRISGCWGDGICIGAKKTRDGSRVLSRDVVIDGVVSTGNRRQGLSIGGSRDVRVSNCEFSHTSGTAPQCGIDIEPDRPDVTTNVRITNCRIHDNAAHGILAYRRTRAVAITGCVIQHNRRCGVVTDGCAQATVSGNTICDNGATGLLVKPGSVDGEVGGNTFCRNGPRRTARAAFATGGITPGTDHDIRIAPAASGIRVDTNFYR
jgi:hypothetical protein